MWTFQVNNILQVKNELLFGNINPKERPGDCIMIIGWKEILQALHICKNSSTLNQDNGLELDPIISRFSFERRNATSNIWHFFETLLPVILTCFMMYEFHHVSLLSCYYIFICWLKSMMYLIRHSKSIYPTSPWSHHNTRLPTCVL